MDDDRRVERDVRAALDVAGVAYQAMEIDPALADTATFCEHYGVAPEDSANCIVVASRDDPPALAACVVLATHRLDVNRTVRTRLGAKKVSFAPPERTRDLTGMTMGGVTPFGLPTGLPLWVDAAVMERDTIIVGGGSRSLKLRVAPTALVTVGGQVVEGLARPPG